MVAIVAQMDVKIATLKVASVKREKKRTGSTRKLSVENADLRNKVKKLKEKVEILSIKNEDLTQQLLKTHTTESEKMTLYNTPYFWDRY